MVVDGTSGLPAPVPRGRSGAAEGASANTSDGAVGGCDGFDAFDDGVQEPSFSVDSRLARPDPHARPAGQKGGQLIDIRAAPNIGKRDVT
jgi:hypothetical protein